MAARIRKIRHDENTRAKIQVSQLINRLQNHIFNSKEKKHKLDTTQIKAIEILLKKTLPDLSSIEGNVNVSVSHDEAIKEIESTLTIEHVPHVITH